MATPQRAVTVSSRTMGNPLVAWVRRLSDPLASANHAQRWIAELPSGDVLAIQKEALDLIAGFPASRRDVGPAQVEALLRIDSRLEPCSRRSRASTRRTTRRARASSRGCGTRLSTSSRRSSARTSSRSRRAIRAPTTRWRAILPWVLVRLAHHRGLDGRYRLFRYSHWIPAQWRDFHELYEFARMRGWQREQLVLGGGAFAQPGITLEQEYVQTLLLMRLDSGNFTPDQVEWVARQLADWAPTLTLVPPPGDGAGFYVDLTGSQGLRRRDKPTVGGRSLYLDLSPVYARVVERMRWLPEQDDATLEPATCRRASSGCC
jgi:hypothetical protein